MELASISQRFATERATRSILVITSTSPSRAKSSAASSCGRSASTLESCSREYLCDACRLQIAHLRIEPGFLFKGGGPRVSDFHFLPRFVPMTLWTL